MSKHNPIKPIQAAELNWNDQNLPIATDFDDVYFSKQDGLAETRYVFLQQNKLWDRWLNWDKAHFVVAESGFGTGLNFLACYHLFEGFRQSYPDHPLQRLYFISFELYPLAAADLSRALGHWPELADYQQQLVAVYPEPLQAGCNRLSFKDQTITLDLWVGDIQDSLKSISHSEQGLVDSWFLDGFAPSKNPQMWNQDLFDGMARLSRPSATLATFTAAGFVRRGLQQAGFVMQKSKGFGHKREMLIGHYPEDLAGCATSSQCYARPQQRYHDVAIIGAGIAGASLAYALTKRGVNVTLYEQHSKPAQEASGNQQGAVYPLLSPAQPHVSEFYLQALNFNLQGIKQLQDAGEPIEHQLCGMIQLSFNQDSLNRNQKLADHYHGVQLIDSHKVSALANLELEHGGLYYPQAGWVSARQVVEAYLSQALKTGKLNLQFEHQFINYQALEELDSEPTKAGITLQFNQQRHYQHQALVLCHANQATQLEPKLPLSKVRGQVSHIQSKGDLTQLKTVLCYDGYLTPSNANQQHCLGATYRRDQEDLSLSQVEHDENLNSLSQTIKQAWTQDLELAEPSGRAAQRCVVRDHLPLIGAMPLVSEIYSQSYQQQFNQQASPSHPNVYLAVGFGSRGISSAPLACEVLACELLGEPSPLSQRGLDALHPGRFWSRRLLKRRPLP